MHLQAYEYVKSQVKGQKFNYVVEFGSLNINGSVRELFNCNHYHGIDLQAGPGVDQLADASSWWTAALADVIVCCEVLEHSPYPAAIIDSAYRNIKSDESFIVTCATDPRAPHSAKDGGWLRKGEYYGNIDPDDFILWCNDKFKIEDLQVIRKRGDLYATCKKI